MIQIVPTILVKNAEEFKERFVLVAPFVSRVQWDIMDGKFVNNTTFSDPAVLDDLPSQLATRNLQLAIEADLMVSDPAVWITRLAHPGIDRLIFHIESTEDPAGLLESARAAGFSVGITLEPETPLEKVWNLLPSVDLFQAMGVKSGFGGQAFIPSVLEKIKKVREAYPNLPIAVDGGVNLETAPKMVAAGATILCAGSFIFNAPDLEKAVKSLKEVKGG